MQNDPIQQAVRRTEQYWYEDGLWEISFGMVYAGLAVLNLFTEELNFSGPLALVLPLLQIGVMLGIFWLAGRMVKYLKEHITYPRSGYVSYRKPTPRSRTLRIVVTSIISALMAALVIFVASFSTMQDRMPFIVSLPMAGALVYLGYRFSLLRMYILAALMPVAGYVISMLPLGDEAVIALFFGVMAALMILSGLVTLALYLWRTHPAQLSEDV